MRVRVALVMVCLARLVGAASAQTISLNGIQPPTGLTLAAAAPVLVDIAGGPGNTGDWIGLYPTGASDSAYVSWSYLSGTSTPPATGLADASLLRTAPVAAGTYEWRLYANSSFTRVATSGPLTVTASASAVVVNGAVAPASTTAVAGSTLVVTVMLGPGHPTDWVALAAAGAPDSEALDWRYLNDTTVAPSSGLTGGTLTFLAPAAPGAYEVRFFAVNSYGRLATSGPVHVTASPAALVVNGTAPPTAVPVAAGTYVTVDVTAGPGHPGDWVSLFAANAADSAFLSWRYLNGSTTPPVSGFTDATLTFGVPVTPASYELRFFNANSYVRLATSTSLVVSAAMAHLAVNGVASPTSTTAAPGTQAIVSVAAGPGNAGDWVGLYAAGAADSEVLDWRYLNDTGTAPATGLTTGTLHVGVPTTAGTYEFRFFMDYTFGRLATSGPLVVPQTPAQIAVNGTAPPTSVTVAPGSTITATITGGPGNPTDWVALAVQGAPNSAYVSWQYLNGSTIPPSIGLTSGTVSVTLPSGPATYELRLFASNSPQRVVSSAPIVASTAPPVVTLALTSPFPGTTFNAPASLVVAAHATISGGTIQHVDFYDGAALIGTATASPYAVTWTAPAEGLHTLTAVAVDQTSATTTSAHVPVMIAPAGATQGTLAAPRASPPGGVIASGQLVTLSAAPGTMVYYTTDGSAPDQSAALYDGPFTVSQALVLRARAYQAGWTESEPSSDSFVIDTTGPTITVDITPGANAAGWNNTPVVVSFECLDPSGVASCPAPVAVTEDGAAQLVTVTATDALGFQSARTVTINIDTTPPVVALTAPIGDISTPDATLALSGQITDAGSGLALVRCVDQAVSVNGAAASCVVPLDPGLNPVVLAAIDVAGNSSSAGLRVTRTAPPTAIVLAPTTLALAVGDTRALTATSDAALPVTGLTWVSSDASVVTVDPANDGTIVAEGLGQATITATLGGLTATTTIRVLPGGIAPGETIWTAAPTPGRYVHAMMRANPALDEDPDLFSVEVNGVTSAMAVKAVRGADGVTLWSHAVPERPQASDAFGGFLYVEHEPGQPFSSSALRRVGGGGVVPWTYHSRSGYIGSAAAAPDGTVYLTEYRYSPSSQLPTNNNPEPARVDTYIVGLDGQTGAVRFRRSLPNGTARYPAEADGGVCVSPLHTDGGLLGPITVLENGDAAVQHEVQHFNVGGSCQTPGPMFRQTALSVWRVSREGAMTSTALRQYSGTWPDGYVGVGNEYFTPSVNRPDGHGGMLATWQHAIADPVSGGQYGNVSRIFDGAVVFTQPAPWAQYFDDRERSDLMVASGGTVYLSDGLNGELIARETETWALKWASQTHGAAIEALADGNLLRTSTTANGAGIETVDASGVTLGSTSASVSAFLNALPDQDVIFGVEEVTGALAQISAPTKRRTLWSFLKNVFGGCTQSVLKANQPTSQDIGLVHPASPQEYTFDFKDTGPYVWSADQVTAVTDAFSKWQEDLQSKGLNYRFRAFDALEHAAAIDPQQPQADVQLLRLPLPPDSNGDLVGGDWLATATLPNKRATKGRIRFNTNPAVLSSAIGYRKVGLHEIGHALGLSHPSKVSAGGTVMNGMRGMKAWHNGQWVIDLSNDAGGNIPLKPTDCDLNGVVDASTK